MTDEAPETTSVAILTMKLSGNREEYYVRIKKGQRTIDIARYGQAYYNRALYMRDELRHVLLGTEKPDLMVDTYADPITDTPPEAET